MKLSDAKSRKGSGYPSPFDVPCRERVRYPIGDAGGLTQFGVNVLELAPGSWSSQRHWHSHEDELVYVLEGEVVLVSNAGEQTLRAGEFACFPAGVPDGHHLQNRSKAVVKLLEVGSRRDEDGAVYPDIDLIYTPNGYTKRDGTPY